MEHDVRVVSTKPARGQPPKWQAVCYTENLPIGEPQDDHGQAWALKEQHQQETGDGED